MASTGPTLNLTYDDLLDEIKSILHVLCQHNSSPLDYSSITDAFDRGIRSGAIAFWYSLALTMRDPRQNCDNDRLQLRILAGLSINSQESPGDVR